MKMKKLTIIALITAFVVGLPALVSSSALAQGMKPHKVVFHVDSSNPKIQNMTLNNVQNVNKYYRSKGEKVQIEVVTYGPGLHMLRTDTSKVKARIQAISLELDNVAFAACGNTMRKMTQKEGKKIPIMSEAKNVPSGVVRLIELQEKGWSYVRP